MNNFQQLIIITSIRRLISGTEDPPVHEIMQSNILNVISTIFKFNDVTEEIKVMKVKQFLLILIVRSSLDNN